jgi:NTE family protein
MISENRPRIGAAFSGGGVRGLAHLGVLQVLEEAGVCLDAVAGTSMGGLVAGLYAAGVSLDEMVELATSVGIVDFASLDQAWRGLFDHHKMEELLVGLLGSKDLAFEDLDIRAAVIAAAVETAEIVVLDSGSLIPALVATAALPGFFAPVRHQGRWLVDGGALNNLPVDVVRRMGVDRVLGVNVPLHFRLPMEEGEPKALSARGILSLGNGTLDWEMPLLIAEASLGMTTGLVDRRRLALCPPDLLLEIDLPNVGLLDTGHSAQVIEVGRETALQRVPELKDLQTRPLRPRWRRRLSRLVRRLRRAWACMRERESLCYPELDWKKEIQDAIERP